MEKPKRSSMNNSLVQVMAGKEVVDSLNDEDEVEDENRSPVSMQINHTSSVTRAGVKRGNFGPARKLSPTMPKATLGHLS